MSLLKVGLTAFLISALAVVAIAAAQDDSPPPVGVLASECPAQDRLFRAAGFHFGSYVPACPPLAVVHEVIADHRKTLAQQAEEKREAEELAASGRLPEEVDGWTIGVGPNARAVPEDEVPAWVR